VVKIGVLALQGDFHAHGDALRAAGAEASEVVDVRRAAQLDGLAGLVMPGGESTTLLNLMADEPWFDSLREFYHQGGVLFGTCAGAILLSREVLHPEQPSLGLLDAVIERNGYGRQRESFETELELTAGGDPLRAVFIRAPRFRSVGRGVEILGRLDGEPVLVRQGRVLAGTFHPELTGDVRLHRYFVEMAAPSRVERNGEPIVAVTNG
jgi:5'-phosphate synthase pdxT subunit